MNLTYRGIKYTPNVPAATTRQTLTVSVGKYRGTSYLIEQYKRPLAAQTRLNLSYRGAYYRPLAPCPADFVWSPI